ncbi:Glycerol-3-phosphate ABC transporter, permease protein UgpE [Labilithrix luteola]|uniref:sn-glycerol-3-phosphate transport system permease protein UgpE n=1 Tax=Labilithrix luteola TaxID=1391654 RepID=A0A0K1Q956_9BACT|nr:carbohydrate ABC transporter permease [Labilithrix luteola]AKV01955.1 Glycerol-3-phosphate ABC transporter, permease protein UgpE [Labilithrix luteola]
MTSSSKRAIVPSILAVVAATIWVLPYLWMVVTSLKPLGEIVADPTAPLPKHPGLDAYREVFELVPVGRYLLVSLVVAVVIGVLQLALALPAGYALAKLRFVGKKTAFVLVVACLLVPPQVTFVSIFLMFSKVGLTNTFGALVLPFAASALGTFLVRQALVAVPDEIIEAARLDGASELTIIYRILAPLLRPTLVSVFLVSFVYHYSDYFWPLVMTTDDTVRTLPLGVALLKEPGSGVRWHVVMAGNVILSAPVLALFALVQKELVRGVGGS